MKITLVIPAYNEAEGVLTTAERLRPVMTSLRENNTLEVLFIDDGSQDETQQLLRHTFADDADVTVIPHGVNKGLGAALRTGFTHATGDVIVTTDFDGTYAFENIPVIVEKLQNDGVDIVTASPYHPDGGVEGVPGWRLVFSQGASLLYRLIVNWRIRTWTALFRAYRQRVVKTITFESDDFLAGTELLVYAIRAGFTVSEYPTVLRQRTFGQSSIKVARVTLLHLKFLGRVLTGRTTKFTEVAA